MRTVAGKYNGQVVVLDEPIPVNEEVRVLVTFPDPPAGTPGGRFRWLEAQELSREFEGSIAEEVIRQRRLE